MNHKMKILTYALGGFLLFSVTGLVMLGSTGQLHGLSEAHAQEERIEKALYEKKSEREALQSKLDIIEKEIIELREERARLVDSRNEIINSFKQERETPKTTEAIQSEAKQPEANFDIDKLAYAVSMAETSGCTKGYGKEYNNCFGIKNGSIAPCEKIGRNRMCVYEKTEDSFEAFKKIWSQGYGTRFPTYKDAQAYSGNDRPDTWLSNVTHYY